MTAASPPRCARSSRRHTKARFTKHFKDYLALNQAVAKASSGEERTAAAGKLTATLNADMEACQGLEKKLAAAPRPD